MKKLIVGSFTFAMAIMLCTSVFAQTLDIYSFEGDEGLVDRSEPVNSGDVLNIKTTWIKQNQNNYKNDILSKGITINGDGEVSGTSAVPESGARVTINGGEHEGFYMDKSASSTMNNLNLTGFYYDALFVGEWVQEEEGSNDRYTNNSISPKLTLNDVNIYSNSGDIYVVGKGAELNIVSNAAIDDQNYTYIGNNWGFYVEDGATVNFKGNNIDLADYTSVYDGTINNNSNLFFRQREKYLRGESVFNNSKELENNSMMYVYDNSVFNNKGTMNNKGLVYLLGSSYYEESENGELSLVEEYHPIYNNDGELYNDRQVTVGYNATFNNNNYIENNNSISVVDGALFNNKGDIDNNGGIFVLGQFENKGNINGAEEEYIYIGNFMDQEQYAIFNNDGKMVYDYGLVDTNGILNNNGTIISNGSVEDKYVTIYGELNNKSKIDAKYLWLGSGQITGGVVTGGAIGRRTVARAADPSWEPVSNYTPILKNYGTINVSEGIGGEDISEIYNEGTINLGGEENERFKGTLIVNGGTINLMKDSLYFNNAAKHTYIDGTLNLVNDTIDDINMNSLYLKGTTDLKLDVDLTDRAGDFLNVVGLSEGENNDNEIGTTASVSSSDSGRFLINKIKILSDSEEKRTEVPIANITPQEYINLGVHRVFSLYEYKVIITSSSAEYEPINGPVIVNPSSSDPTTGDGTTGDGTAGSDAAEQKLDETGSEYGNTLVFIRKDDKYRNPEILQSKVAIAGANISQDEIFTTVFNNAGNYTFFQKQGTSAGDVEDRAAPTLWVKAFGSKEDVELEEYTTVETTYYGAIVGLDWDRQYSDNFDATYGIFASYIGGELKDTEFDNKVDQSGGYIGVRGNWYIGKLFFNGIIDYALIQNGADTAEDNVDFNSQVAGLAARVGYNFEVANKSFTIQPNFAMTGKYIMSDDYDTVVEGDKKKMEIGNITNLTFEPGLKLIKNLGRCWILTGEGRYVIENVSGDVKYDSQVLPDTSYDNFTYLGLGIEKIWGYTVLHLKGSKTFGGRDGYIINAGVEFKF